MDVRAKIGDLVPDISLCVALSTPVTHFVAGFESGIRCFTIEGTEVRSPPNLKGRGIGLVQPLEKSDIVAVVGGGVSPMWSPNKAVIYSMESDKVVLEIPCLSPIRGVRLTRKDVIIMLDNEVRRFGLLSRPEFKTSYPTAPNPHGLCAVAEGRIIAFPGQSVGQVQTLNLDNDGINIIPAHSGALRAIALSPNGRLLATASEQGTIIRVWSTLTGAKVCEFRRGWDPALIYSIAINVTNTMLASTSDKGTLHVYDIPRGSKAAAHATTAKAQSKAAENPVPHDSEDGRGDKGKGKWGALGKIGILPQYFRDAVSFASTQFWMDNTPTARPLDEDKALGWDKMSNLTLDEYSSARLNVESKTSKKPLPRGILGWTEDDTCVVVGCGNAPRIEVFAVASIGGGQRILKRVSWNRYPS